MNIIKEQEPAKKNTRAIIAQYVDRKDLHGLAEFARAMMEDSMDDRSQLLQEIEERVKDSTFNFNVQSDSSFDYKSGVFYGSEATEKQILTIITSFK